MFRADNVVFANIAVEECAFKSERGAQAIVEVSACGSERKPGLVALHHVAFRNNELSGASALRVTSPSCSELKMRDVEISDNVCSREACGVLLRTKNRIEGIRLLRNRLADSVDGFPSLLFASTSSNTAIEGLEAADNSLTVIQIRDGALSLSNASFDHNQLNTEKEAGNGTCIHLVQSSAAIAESKFAKNKGTWGSCLYAEESKFTVSGSEFVGNAADQGGGFSCVSDSTAKFEQVKARNNIAKLDGGCVFAVNTELEFTTTTVMGNRAERYGGCIRLVNSNATLSETSARNNSAGEDGGFMNMDASMASLNRTKATGNEAANGGAISLWISNATSSRIIAVNNRAEKHGGCIRLVKSNVTLSETNASHNSAGEDGGFLSMDASMASLNRTKATGNEAANGGAISLWISSVTLNRTTAVKNNATNAGGFIRAYHSSTAFVDTTATDNSAGLYGGCIRLVNSSATLSETSARNNSAGEDGGFMNMDNSTASLDRTTATDNSAGDDGGFLNMYTATASLNRTTATGNEAANGGAISLWISSVTLNRTTAVKNNATNAGGFIRAYHSSTVFVDTTATDNSAGLYGGCIRLVNSSATLSETSARNNSAGEDGGFMNMDNSTASLDRTTATDNSAGDDGGFLNMYTATASLNRTTATGNEAANGGAISLWISSVTLNRTTAVKNNATNAGGFIRAYHSSTVFVDTTATDNSAGLYGGCIRLVNSSATLSETSARNNSAGEDGGFMNMDNSTASLDRTTATDNSAGDDGGFLNMYTATASLNRTTATGNEAANGGAISLWISSVTLNRTTAVKNNATNAGGFIRAYHSSTVFVDTTATDNSAGLYGGCIFANNSTLNVSRSTVSKGRAASSGGLLAAANSTVYMKYSTLKYGRSKNGGAMWLNETRFDGKSLSIVRCEADDDGGGIKGDHSSSLLCINCTLRANVAKTGNGGAVSFEAVRNQSQTVQLLSCSVLNNTANLGGDHLCPFHSKQLSFVLPGGLYFTCDQERMKCLSHSGNCSVSAIVNTTFQYNQAAVAGGAIFAGSLSSMLFSCFATSEEDVGFSLRQNTGWRNLSQLEMLDDICPAWKDNVAQVYGPSVGTCAAKAIVEEIKDKVVAIPGKTSVMIKGYVSGEELPPVEVQLFDDLDQGPPEGVQRVEAKMSFPETFLIGSIIKPIQKGKASFSGIRGFVPPGNHSLSIAFIGAVVEDIEIIVSVENCSIGQVVSSGGLCANCSTTSYNLLLNDDTCKPCPENADCESLVILPEDGYWHRTPCSSKIQRCLTTYACEFEERSENLKKLTKDVKSCVLDQAFIEDYTRTQCTKVLCHTVCEHSIVCFARATRVLCVELAPTTTVLVYRRDARDAYQASSTWPSFWRQHAFWGC